MLFAVGANKMLFAPRAPEESINKDAFATENLRRPTTWGRPPKVGVAPRLVAPKVGGTPKLEVYFWVYWGRGYLGYILDIWGYICDIFGI